MRGPVRIVTMAVVAVLLNALPAAGATLSLKPVPAAGQVVRDHGGRPAIQSELKATTAALVVQSVALDETGAASFLLALQNAGAEPVSLRAEDLSVRAGERKVSVYSVEDLKRAASDRKLIAQSHITAMDQRGVLGGSGARAAYVNLPDGRYIEDPHPPTGSKKQVIEEANRRIAAADAAMVQADTLGFRPVTMSPGAGGWTGLTLAALPKGASTLVITVALGAETHRFELAIAR